MLKLTIPFLLFPLPLLLASNAKAAPSPTNGIEQLLDKSCTEDSCVDGYRVKFKQVRYEGSKSQATVSISLLPNQDIDYPILSEEFEAQLVQSSFAGICKIKAVPSIESIRKEDDSIDDAFKNRLKNCLSALAERSELALGRR